MARSKTAVTPIPQLTISPEDLEEARCAPLDQEIELLRHFIQRVALRTPVPGSVHECAEVLNNLSMAAFTLANLLHTRKELKSSRSPINVWARQVMANELRLKLSGLIK